MSIVTIIFEMSKDNKYNNIIQDESFYSSKEFFIGYSNYRKSKENAAEELLSNLATAFPKAAQKGLQAAMNKEVTEAVKRAARETGGEWRD